MTDAFFYDAKLKINQPKQGYRFAIDSILLAHFAKARRSAKVLDIGCGCGVIGLIMAYNNPSANVTGIDIQANLAKISDQNRAENKLANYRVMHGDVRATGAKDLQPPFDVIVCNPPYFKQLSGKVSQNNEAAIARHELYLSLEDLAKTARSILKTKGKLYMVYPATRIAKLIEVFTQNYLEPKALRFVHSYRTSPASLVLVECGFMGNPGVKILKPLYVYKAQGKYSSEVAAFFCCN